MMRMFRSLLLLASLSLASACDTEHNNLLPPADNPQTWAAEIRNGSGPAATSQINYLTLRDDGEFDWNRIVQGDGISNPNVSSGTSFRAGKYRIRDGFLDLRVETLGTVTTAGIMSQIRVAEPYWTGDEYRIVRQDENALTLRFIPLESSSRTEVTLEFSRLYLMD